VPILATLFAAQQRRLATLHTHTRAQQRYLSVLAKVAGQNNIFINSLPIFFFFNSFQLILLWFNTF
jgi:hypothetical protein